MLTISQKRFFLSLDELALFMEPYIKLSMIAWASLGQGRQNGHLPPAWKLRNQIFLDKPEVSILIPINSFDSCNDSFFAGMKLTLHKSQVHSCSVMQ